MRRFWAGLLLATPTTCGGWPAAATGTGVSGSGAAALVPHKAAYTLSLGELRSSAAVIDAAGRLEFEWADVCDGWAVNQRFRIALLYEDGLSVSYGWRLSSWESKDGRHYRFFIRRFDPGGAAEEVRGEAELDPDGGGRAVFQTPERREIALPAGTLFPTQHTRFVIEQAGEGAAPVWTQVFDGSDDNGLSAISAAIAPQPAEEAPTLASPLLAGARSWHVDLAFYGPEPDALAPEQEQSLRLFDNGIVDEMRLDYGEFVLDADLAELTPLPRPAC